MSSGRISARAFAALAAVAFALGAAPAMRAETASARGPLPVPPATRPTTLDELMRMMAQTSGVVAEFTETKRLALLEAPLETRGTLYFIPPNRMARHTSYPGKSTFIIDGDRLLFEDEAGGDDIDLTANPIARVFVDNFIVLFNGDLRELQRRYRADFTSDAEHWRLHLTPRRAPLSEMVASITMRGDRSGMKSMLLRETAGDETETVFRQVDQSYRFSQDQITRLFRVESEKP